jgi:hypothetical protein
VHPPAFAGAAELQSTVFLYYGSFLAVARRDPRFDIDAEIRETLLHEVQHHVEDQVGHPKLRDQDWAEGENERRRRGDTYRAGFWRGGERVPDPRWDVRRVGGDVFVEVALEAKSWDAAVKDGVTIAAAGGEWPVRPKGEDGEQLFTFEGRAPQDHHGHGGGDLVIVLRRKRSLLDAFRKAAK